MDAISRPNDDGFEMDRALDRHDVHPLDDILDEMPVCARRRQLTFLMSHPICDHAKRAKKSRSHVADAILFLAFGNSPTAAQQATEPDEVVRVFAPYVVKKETGQRAIQTVSVSRDVDFHDLDLSRLADVTMLKQRVMQATLDVCRELDSRHSGGDRKRIAEDRLSAQHASADALAEIQVI